MGASSRSSMGRASRKDKKKKSAGGKRGKKEEEPVPAASVEEALSQAEAFIAQYDHEGALKIYEQVLSAQPDCTAVLDAAGELLLEIGEAEQAQALLTRSVQLAPEGNFATYMYLGQLMQGMDAVACFDRGCQLLLKEMEQAEPGHVKIFRHRLSSALCARAEVYMTDLCDRPEAEQECAKSLASAVEHDATNPDGWVAKANFHICQQDAATALQCLDRASDLISEMEDDDLPPFELRFTVAKLYVELAEHHKVIEAVEDLLCEDEDHVECLFILANALKAVGEVSSARESAARAAELYAKVPPQERQRAIEEKISSLVQSLA